MFGILDIGDIFGYFYVPIHGKSEQHLLPYTTIKVVF
jgi:hypothetical protein